MNILINICYGGFSFSPEFSQYFYTLHPDLQEDNTRLDYCTNINPRTDPRVIEAIKDFGLDRAAGMCAHLSLEEIADGLDYSIDEYDGMESLRTHLVVTLDDLFKGLNPDRMELAKLADSIIVQK